MDAVQAFTPSPFLFFVIAVVFVTIVFIFSGVKQVPQAYEFTLERFGRYTRTLSPGLHLIVPFIDRIGHKLSMQESVLDIPAQDVITMDNASVTCDAVCFFQIVDAARAAYEVRDLPRAMTNITMTNIRSVIGSMPLDDVLSKRDDINERLLRVIDAATNPWGVKVTRVEIKDLSPPRDLVDAMAMQMKAERVKRAEILKAEGDKQSAVLRAEGQKQAAILEAEGRREAAFRDAEAREREGEAEGKATTSLSEAIAAGNVNAVNYFVAQRYVSALEKMGSAPNQKIIMIPFEATGVIGSLAGIAEIAKAALKETRDGPSGAGPWGDRADG
jgi:regulator of protease activity HflC (stomatin/prohibitin superfamily)